MAKRGRVEGSTNRNRQFLLSRLQTMYGEDYHPIMQMAEMVDMLYKRVKLLGDTASNEQIVEVVKACDALAPYIQPKLKAIELSTDGDLGVIFNLDFGRRDEPRD